MARLIAMLTDLHIAVAQHDQLLYEIHGKPPDREAQRIRDSYCALRQRVNNIINGVRNDAR